MLGGGLSAWAARRPEERARRRLPAQGRTTRRPRSPPSRRPAGETERPPEGWLYKAWHENGALVDLIFSPASGPITDEFIERAPVTEVMALRIRSSRLEDVMTSKLLALTEQEPDFSSVLEWARALREQIDWDDVRGRTEASPFAKAFFTLVESLGIVDEVAT